MLTGRKSLAMTSSKPGKTTLINHFLINDQWYIVDLPVTDMHSATGDAASDKEDNRGLHP